jgi:hypothetical protein
MIFSFFTAVSQHFVCNSNNAWREVNAFQVRSDHRIYKVHHRRRLLTHHPHTFRCNDVRDEAQGHGREEHAQPVPQEHGRTH